MPAPDADEEADARKAPRFGPSDHLVEPGTRQEMFRGQIVEVLPARPGHADLHGRLDKVLDLQAADGYVSSSDLLTRRSAGSDFATDASVRRAGTDPATGQRHLEELSFEIFFKQSREYTRERARDVVESGVRRMFGIFVKERWPGSDDSGVIDWTVAEWSADRDDWVHLTPDHVITDSCLRTPVPVKALVDALESDNAAQRALIARGNPELQKHTARERREERMTTVREIIFDLLEDRQIALDTLQRARIEACDDLATLKRWLLRAAKVESAAALLG
ncbi:MAG TPA: hypothetical protein VNM90_07070 [Haliangium sp.]|nr:hypothetical protein [Haliangium sp.]